MSDYRSTDLPHELNYRPEPRNKKAITMTIFAFVGSFLFWIAGTSGAPLPVIWQSCAVILLTAAIMLMTRYNIRRYEYTLYRSDKNAPIDSKEIDLWSFKVVEEISRNRRMIVCHLYARDILSFEEIGESEAEHRAAQEQAKGFKLYNYVCEISPKTFCQMKIRDGEEILCLRLIPDKPMADMIRVLLSTRDADATVSDL